MLTNLVPLASIDIPAMCCVIRSYFSARDMRVLRVANMDISCSALSYASIPWSFVRFSHQRQLQLHKMEPDESDLNQAPPASHFVAEREVGVEFCSLVQLHTAVRTAIRNTVIVKQR